MSRLCLPIGRRQNSSRRSRKKSAFSLIKRRGIPATREDYIYFDYFGDTPDPYR